MSLASQVDLLATRVAEEFNGVREELDDKSILAIMYTIPGELVVQIGTVRLPITHNGTLLNVAIALGAAPNTDDVVMDLNKNGTTMFASGKPTITSGSTESLTNLPTTTAIAAGDFLTVDLDEVGTAYPGADLVVVISYRLT